MEYLPENAENQLYIHPLNSPTPPQFSFSKLQNCKIIIPVALDTIHLRNLKNCIVAVAAVRGACFIDGCENCQIMCISEQLRIGHSNQCFIFSFARQPPTLEEDVRDIYYSSFSVWGEGLQMSLDRTNDKPIDLNLSKHEKAYNSTQVSMLGDDDEDDESSSVADIWKPLPDSAKSSLLPILKDEEMPILQGNNVCIGLPIQEIYQWPMGITKPFIMEVLDMMDFQFFTGTPAMSYALITVLSTVVLSSIFVFIALLFVFKNGDSQVPLFLVRLLRLVTNACVTWGYQPFITIIFMIVDCHWVDGVGYTDVHPEVLCWSGPQLAFNILALITLVAFIPFTQFIILFLYDFDCKHDILLSAYSGRYEFIEMLFKCVITAQSQWVSTYTHFRCVTCIAGFGFLMFYIMWMQPYHSLHSNVWASSQYVPTVASSVYAWISVFTEGSNDLVIAFFWTSFFFFCIFGTWVLALYARQIYLSRLAITYDFKIPVKSGLHFVGDEKPFYKQIERCEYRYIRGIVHENPKEHDSYFARALQQTAPATVSESEEQGNSTQNKDFKSVFMKHKTTLSYISQNRLETVPYIIPKLKHVSHIDQAVRFVWRPEVRRRKEYIAFADAIYKEGLIEFPRHPGLRIHYALFLRHYKKDWEGCMQQLHTAYKLGATIDNRWIIFFMDKVYEQENSGADLKSADVMSLFRYKNHLYQAELNHKEAKEKLTTILTMLENNDDDVGVISSLLDELIDNEKEAAFHYAALLQSHPFSIPVLTGFANLKMDIFREDQEAQLLLNKAMDVEMEMHRLNRRYRPTVKAKSSNRVGAKKFHVGLEDETANKRDSRFFILKYGMPFTVVLFLLLSIWLFFVGFMDVSNTKQSIVILQELSDASTMTVRLAALSKLYSMRELDTVPLTLDPAYYLSTTEVLEELEQVALDLHKLTITGVFDRNNKFITWRQFEVKTFTPLHAGGVLHSVFSTSKTLPNAVNHYTTQLYTLSQLDNKLSFDSKLDIVKQTLMTCPTTLSQAFLDCMATLCKGIESQNNTMTIVCIVIIILDVLVTVTVVSFIYFLLTRLNTSRNDALFFFLAIKNSVLAGFQQRLKGEDDDEEEKQDKMVWKMFVNKFNQSKVDGRPQSGRGHASSKKKSEDNRESHRSPKNPALQLSTKPIILPEFTKRRNKRVFTSAVPKSTIIIFVVLFSLLAIALALGAVVMMVIGVSGGKWPGRIAVSGQRQSGVYCLQMLSLLLLAPEQGNIPIETGLRTTKFWTGFEHLSPTRDDVLAVFEGFVGYLQELHDRSRFGVIASTVDDVIGSLDVHATLEISSLHSLMFDESHCFITQEYCKEHPNRMPTTDFANENGVFGVESLFMMMIQHSHTIIHYPVSSTDSIPNIYLTTAVNYDLSAGLHKMTDILVSEANNSMLVNTVLLIICVAIDGLLIVIVFVMIVFKMNSQLEHVQSKTQKIKELVPLDETMAIRWSKTFTLGDEKVDGTHRLVLDAAAQLLDHMIRDDEKQVLTSAGQVRDYLKTHTKEEAKLISTQKTGLTSKYVRKLKEYSVHFNDIMQRFENGFDVTEAMYVLFTHFIETHILEDNRMIIENRKITK
ncbi:putative Tubulin binding cofactor C [Blattamonas nauphoetae]|uniref:Tubulin binding cofactor C n=1 Tax=Blattamonas nauphoetae TaxID=2049346 RepID=A0ABQ9YMF6_9EUKA|nr:putative Tubulin binding cofactor C [Blattamonas nauphoetae]